MSNIINLHNETEINRGPVYNQETDLVKIADGVLLDTRASMENKSVVTMPIAQLATLGAGVSSLLPAFRTLTQTTTVPADGLYRLANAAIGDTLKVAKNGNFWGAFKTAEGTSKFAQLQAVGTTAANSSMVMPIDPATLMMAVALFSIEQKLGSIEEMQQKIISFLAIDQESEIEADIETLSSMMTKYKYNWDNENFITNNHKMVLDIQRTARKHLNFYQKQVAEVIGGKKLFVSQSKVNDALADLLRKFKYYRLTMYTFSMASFVEIILSGDFKEENIQLVKEELEKLSSNYRDLFGQCSAYLEKLSDSSVETNVLKGLGTASKAVGKFIDSIPKIRDGQVDEFLQERGEKMHSNATRIERQVIEAFAEISNPGVWMFVEKLEDLIQIYGRTTEICFDEKQVYLIAG